MKRTVLPLLICCILVVVAVCPSYAVDPSLKSIYTKVEQILQLVTSNQTQVSSIQTQLTSIQTQIGALSTDVDGLSTQIDALSDKFDLGLTVTPKSYYLTKDIVPANQAITACATGFHMASFFEIMDPTMLQYVQDTNISFHRDASGDQGSGPPSDFSGWVRTGNATDEGMNFDIAGSTNCNSWTSIESGYNGTNVRLAEGWKNEPTNDEFIPSWWISLSTPCDNANIRVWCVQD